MNREINVFADWEGLGGPRRMGLLRAIQVHGNEVFSFEYDREWLESDQSMLLDPDLRLYEGPQYLSANDRPNFGLFLDSSPDRWGRLLMKRREAVEARIQNWPERRLSETDFLLGVHDEQRMGALRFKESIEGPFLSDDDGMTVPPWTRLRELASATRSIQSAESDNDPRIREWLTLLIAPGSSIGGARPKAGVCDESGDLWIAKFPGRNDEWDIGAWEMVANDLAAEAGIIVAEARIEKLGRSHHTFLTKRFDRRTHNGTRLRRHFASAMTMLGYFDGTDFRDGASYLELVEFLSRCGANVDADLEQLWKRVVFSICICNTDDHLRNHGFLLSSRGWNLSPAYDLNPSPHRSGLSLNVTENDNSLDLDLALDVCEFFRLKHQNARNLIRQIKESVRKWNDSARKVGIPRSEQDQMATAFQSAFD